MTSAGEVFLLQCSKCGAKMTQSGSTIGGSDSCVHKYGPIQKNIVYPTDAERNWLQIIDQNKDENIMHTKKFENDVSELNNLKSIAMQAITTKIKTLQAKLEARQDELEQELTLAFQDRRNKINENVKILNDHKLKNEEAKEKSEDLLAAGDKKEAEREKIIVSECETIINTTPNLQYIETELRFTFNQLATISRKISKYGILITQPIDSGIRCIFKSTVDATNSTSSTPKQIELPTIQLKSSTFDTNKQKVKLSFKLSQRHENKDIDIHKYLLIYVECSQDIYNDDEDEKGDEFGMKQIHQQIVPFKYCKMKGNVNKKYELYVNKKFSPGITVAFKLKPKFNSPNKEKFSDCEGRWSREQTYDIPEESESDKEEKVIFYCMFNNKKDKLILNGEFGDDNALTNYKKFIKEFKNKFNIILKENEIFELIVNNNVVLNDTSIPVEYASDSYLIRGNIKQKHDTNIIGNDLLNTIQQQNKTIKQLEQANSDKQQENTELRQKVSSLEGGRKEYELQINSLKNENTELRQKVSSLEGGRKEYELQINSLKNENTELRQKVSSLEDERKEYEMQINDLKNEIRTLKVKSIDINEFKEWNEDDVLNWIFSIDNGLFIKYENKLKEEIKSCEIKGIDLLKVTRTDIKEFGVTKFADQKVLQEHIETLKQTKNKKRRQVGYNEGINVPTAYI
eukprot:31661_1